MIDVQLMVYLAFHSSDSALQVENPPKKFLIWTATHRCYFYGTLTPQSQVKTASVLEGLPYFGIRFIRAT